jgi:hypothetical protein
MTHSLHRRGDAADLRDDFVMLVMAGDRMKHDAVRSGMGEVWDLLSQYGAQLANYGTLRGGGRHKKPIEQLKAAAPWIIHAVFSSRETLRQCLAELKARDLGVSVAVSGCDQEVAQICAELSLEPHTVQYSLGIHGRVQKLADEGVLAISTMCGHAMVSPNLIGYMIERIGRGKMTHAQAAAKLTGMCDCGVFNQHKAERLLKQMTAAAGDS